MSPIIKIEGLSKRYMIDHRGAENYSTLRETFMRGAKNAIQTPLSWVGLAPARRSETREEFWALKDVSFDIAPGERVGIIGRNGAGKSTLLKILSRITEPTKGKVRIRGRVASLLEVGTGFHPELTGRENIFLNGSILGMSRTDINRRFDEIVAFSEVERFLDTPVKRYSSGMYVRLAFAVAAHLEPEILIVDEVLAVGDVQFQRKCLGKMTDVADSGTTVLFVSHNLAALSNLCTRGVLLRQGCVDFVGNIEDTISRYAEHQSLGDSHWQGDCGDENVRLEKTWVSSGSPDGVFSTGYDVEVGVQINILKKIDGLVLGFTLWSEFQYELAYVLFDDQKQPPPETVYPGVLVKRFRIPANTLAQGCYRVRFDVGIHAVKKIIENEGELSFCLENIGGIGRNYITPSVRGRTSLFRPNWDVN